MTCYHQTESAMGAVTSILFLLAAIFVDWMSIQVGYRVREEVAAVFVDWISIQVGYNQCPFVDNILDSITDKYVVYFRLI